MSCSNYKPWDKRYLEAMQKTGDVMLRWQFQSVRRTICLI